MKLFELINIASPNISPEKTKLHLAGWNGFENPLDVFMRGDFEDWQSWQSKRNFEREYIVSLIQLNKNNSWLFAGVYKSLSSEHFKGENPHYSYKTEEVKTLNEYTGRIVVDFKRSGRQSYLVTEKWASELKISEMLAKRVVVEDFKGYNRSTISKSKLDLVISQNIESWRAALSNVSGIYLITDTRTGKLYVGSATGAGGIWQRWSDYSCNGHGGNRDLKNILSEKGEDYSANFQYTILEIADTHASVDDILQRESYWKNVLCSREHGFNAN
jgi:hypothetical protein